MAQRIPTRTARFMTTGELLINPHMGFTTFQRFNGDALNPAETRRWTEGFPIEYQPFTGSLENKDHPDTSIAYFRVYWRFFEPEDGVYNFDMIDKALDTAASRGQTLMLRVGPYGELDHMDIPPWLRERIGPEPRSLNDWVVSRHPLYFERYPAAIRALAERYDGDPRLDSVDMSVCGFWGEGAGTDTLPTAQRNAVVDAYTHNFTRTPLMGFIVDPDTILYANQTRPVGYRADCLGDMNEGGHMLSFYPRHIPAIAHVWEKAPVSFEVCWVVYHWLDMGWDIDYIIEQSLKWHITSFNAKSSPIPPEWKSNVDDWCRRMGYRLALRFFDYPDTFAPGDLIHVGAWIENLGVAPCYHSYPLTLRLKNEHRTVLLPTGVDALGILPGDRLWQDRLTVPADLPCGDYSLQIAFLDPHTGRPGIRMPLTAETDGGFTVLGNVRVTAD